MNPPHIFMQSVEPKITAGMPAALTFHKTPLVKNAPGPHVNSISVVTTLQIAVIINMPDMLLLSRKNLSQR
jgi:hypothetical protein